MPPPRGESCWTGNRTCPKCGPMMDNASGRLGCPRRWPSDRAASGPGDAGASGGTGSPHQLGHWGWSVRQWPQPAAVAGAGGDSPPAGHQEQREAVGLTDQGPRQVRADPTGVRGGRIPLDPAQRRKRGQGSPGLRLDQGGDTAPEGTWKGLLAFGPPQHCSA